MTPIRITRHARNRMRWHGIGDDLVRETVQVADWEDASTAGRVNRWKKVEDRFLRVTCKAEAGRIVVISAVFKRRGPKGTDKP